VTTTATLDELNRIDDTERMLIRSWSAMMRARTDTDPAFVASLIVTALDYEPRFALTFSPCSRVGCELFVDDDAADESGRVWCGDEHRDADAEDAAQRDLERLYAAGAWIRRSGPPSIQLFPIGVDPWGPR
jgi:hypothetical protein